MDKLTGYIFLIFYWPLNRSLICDSMFLNYETDDIQFILADNEIAHDIPNGSLSNKWMTSDDNMESAKH